MREDHPVCNSKGKKQKMTENTDNVSSCRMKLRTATDWGSN